MPHSALDKHLARLFAVVLPLLLAAAALHGRGGARAGAPEGERQPPGSRVRELRVHARDYCGRDRETGEALLRCRVCGGSGEVFNVVRRALRPCPWCEAEGRTREGRRVTVVPDSQPDSFSPAGLQP